MRRALLTLVCLGAVVVPPGPATAVPAQSDGTSPDLVITGFAQGGTRMAVVRESTALDQVDIVGAALTSDGTAVRPPPDDAVELLGKVQGADLRAELLLTNYSNRLGDFDPRALHRLLSAPDRISAVAEQVAGYVDDHGWDGVNVDFERVRAGDAAGLVALVSALQQAMPVEKSVSIDLSAATSLESYRDRGYAMKGLGKAADVVALMAYDYHGPTWSGPGAIGPLDWQTKAVDAALEAVPADRLDLGVAGYGYTWPRTGTGHTVTDAGARRLVERDGVTARWHADVGEWSARLADGTRMWWSDARSYRLRLDLARDRGLHGVAVWRLGSADKLVKD